MLEQNSPIHEVATKFNNYRVRLEGNASSKELQALDDEYTLIHSFIESLIEDKHLNTERRMGDLKDYLQSIANGEQRKFKSPLLQKMVSEIYSETFSSSNKSRLGK